MISVLLVDDHAVVRNGLQLLLGEFDDIHVVGTAADGAEASRVAARERPDVVLMDLEMGGVDGIEGTRLVSDSAPEARVVILTSFSDRQRILDALDAGAVGYLLKDVEPDELARGIRAAARGESPLAPRAASAVLRARTEKRPTADLTPREREVLSCIGEGLPNKLIARKLGISEKTVKAHVTRIFSALGVTDRTQAALWFERQRHPS
ncbi:MAG: response regulator transcription factor [Solirubrobacteraceae bacterium]|nr:response regulator transcription factor [Patulibacter sp.]